MSQQEQRGDSARSAASSTSSAVYDHPRTGSVRSGAVDAERLEMDIAVSELDLGDQIGAGNFSKVFKGVWRGRDVAIKRQQLPQQKELDKWV